MAGPDRQTLHRLIDRVLEDGARLPFEGVVRLLHEVQPQNRHVGHDGPPRTEPVRFRQRSNLGFGSGDLGGVRRVAETGSGFRGFEVTTNFLGLAGAESPLPAYYLEDFTEDLDERNLVGGLLDLLHHRLLSLFYRAQQKHRHSTTYRWDASDPLSKNLLSFGGGEHATGRLEPGTVVRFASVLMRQSRSGEQIERCLQAAFPHVPLQLEPCLVRWVAIPPDQRLRLGTQNHQLGVDAVIGEMIRDRSSTFGLRIGPMPIEDFDDFLPGGGGHRQLKALLNHLVLDGIDCVVTLSLKGIVPPLVLAKRGQGGQRLLGCSARLTGHSQSNQTVSYLISGT